MEIFQSQVTGSLDISGSLLSNSSTRFGSLSSNTHQFTGSADITGSLTVRTGKIFMPTSIDIQVGASSKIIANTTNVVIGGANDAGTLRNENVIIGQSAGRLLSGSSASEASDNTILGAQSGKQLTTGLRNTIIGAYAGSSEIFNIGNVSNKFVLGAGGAGAGGTLLGGDFLNGQFWVNPTVANVTSPDASVAFGINATPTGVGVSSTIRGFLGPRTTLSGRTGIGTPATGLEIYQTDGTEGQYVNLSTGWQRYLTTADTGSLSVLNAIQLATASFTASVSPTQFTVTSGSVTEFTVTGTGVNIGNIITDNHNITGSLRISGSANISTAVTSSTLLVSGSGTQRVTIIGSGSAQPVFSVLGSQGELFSITDSLSGSLFSVNDISGLPILEVFSDNTTLMGNYLAPSLNTTNRVVTTNSGSFTVYAVPTASYDGIFMEYTAKSGSNARAGQFMAIWSGSLVNFTDNTTTDFGSTAVLSFTGSISGSSMVVTGNVTTGSGWTIKSIIRSI